MNATTNHENIIAGMSTLYPSVDFEIENDALVWTDGPEEEVVRQILSGIDIKTTRKYSVGFIKTIAAQVSKEFKNARYRIEYHGSYGPAVCGTKNLVFVGRVWQVARNTSA